MRSCGNKKCGLWMVVIIPAVVALHSFAFMSLWNHLITDIFSLRIITFWETLGLVAMAKLLFMVAHKGGCKGKKRCHSHQNEEGSKFNMSMREHFKSKYCCSTKEEEKEE